VRGSAGEAIHSRRSQRSSEIGHRWVLARIDDSRMRWPIRMYRAVTVIRKGPGDQLHRLILRWFGEDFTDNCGCRAYVAKMNAWGVEGCRRRIDRIARKLFVEAGRRGMLESGIPAWKWMKKLVAKRVCRWIVRRMISRPPC
jgi:hypothetical protein